MQDMTKGPIPGHVVRMAMPITFGLLFQAAYILIDRYFVTRQGDDAMAGVVSAGNLQFLVMGLTQVLAVGTTTVIAHAVGRKSREDANLAFNQSLLMGALCALMTLLAGYALATPYMHLLGSDAGTKAAGIAFLRWFVPGLALQFVMIPMGSALRGTGINAPGMIVQIATVLINALLAPVLIAGWITGHPFGVAGAGMATSISVFIGVVLLTLYFAKLETYVAFDPASMRPRLATWWRMLRIGLPAGGEFMLMFLYMFVILQIIKPFGASAQAGFGIGSAVMQSIFLPAMAIAFAVSPIAGQNVGARLHDRVRETFRHAAIMSSIAMLALTLFCQWSPEALVHPFATEHNQESLKIAAGFLRIISLNFVAQGIIFTCSGMFQALGNTVPAMLSSATRLLTFAIPGIMLAHRAGFELQHLWYLSVATVTLQACTSLLLLRGQFRRRLVEAPAASVS
ncbi:MAG TPA: MATE family efflux transporter [Xanthomonadaceae bacterium]|jgi:putative MATE family efflux protein